MPTERFYKLPEEKKKAIRDAAMEECIRVPFEKVSINKIIQNAGISRGSFYTYFEDKRDLVRYIFSDTADKLKFFWTKSVVTHGGDLWIASEELLDQAIIFAQKGKMFQMMQSIVLYQDFDKLFAERQRNLRGSVRGDGQGEVPQDRYGFLWNSRVHDHGMCDGKHRLV